MSGSLSEKTANRCPATSRGRPAVRSGLQVTVLLANRSTETYFSAAQYEAMLWPKDHQAITAIPDHAWSSESFEKDAAKSRHVWVEALGSL